MQAQVSTLWIPPDSDGFRDDEYDHLGYLDVEEDGVWRFADIYELACQAGIVVLHYGHDDYEGYCTFDSATGKLADKDGDEIQTRTWTPDVIFSALPGPAQRRLRRAATEADRRARIAEKDADDRAAGRRRSSRSRRPPPRFVPPS